MIESTFSLLFYLKKSKSVNQKHYVYLRVTVDGRSKELSTKLTCDPTNWNSRKGVANETPRNKTVNDFLDTLRGKVYQVKTIILESGQPLTVETIINFLRGKSPRRVMLLEVFREHIQVIRKLVGNGYTHRTMMRYQTARNHVQNFINATFEINDVEMERVNYKFVSDYYDWLRTEQKCSHNTTVKYMSTFKLILTSSIKKGWLRKNPFDEFKTTVRLKTVNPLNIKELKSLEEAELKNSMLAQVRDVFIFCCYTGLAYIDVKALTGDSIVNDKDGMKWICTNRKKNNNTVRIPMLPKALEILKKYHSDAIEPQNPVLPVLSNQKMNGHLKKLAVECNIAKRLTFHISRHTFATTVTLNNDVPLETVSTMLGHSSIRQTQHYAKVVESKIARDMKALTKRLSKHKGKP